MGSCAAGEFWCRTALGCFRWGFNKTQVCFFKYLWLESDGVLMECPTGIAYGNSCVWELCIWFAVVGSYRVLISRWNYYVVIYKIQYLRLNQSLKLARSYSTPILLFCQVDLCVAMTYNYTCRFINRDYMIISESPIDERYRLRLFDYYLKDTRSALSANGSPKWQFICPFCGSISSKEYKKKHRKAALLWNSTQNYWLFSCARKKSTECSSVMNFSNLISALNPALGEAYRQERYHSGTTGKGHNCRAPQGVTALSKGSSGAGSIRSPEWLGTSGDSINNSGVSVYYQFDIQQEPTYLE